MSGNSTEKKSPLENKTRMALIKEFRGVRGAMNFNLSRKINLNHSDNPKKYNPMMELPPGYKPIYMRSIDNEEEWVYSGRVLILTVIDDPLTGFSAFNLSTQDKFGYFARVSIYEIPHDEDTKKKLAFGTEIGIINPYYRVAMDMKPGIRVEDPSDVIILGKKKNMCRYCGKENAEKKCSICKRSYCNRECQLKDWKLEHKRICKTSYYD